MSKAKMTEWLFKRIGTKVDELRYAEESEIAQLLADDVDSYLALLKEVVIEVIKP